MAVCNLNNQLFILTCSGMGTVEEQTNEEFIQAKHIVIQPGITEIGSLAFSICGNIETIDFGSTLEIIRDDIFADSAPIKSLFIPKTVKSLSSNIPWDKCKKIKEITVEEGNEYYCSLDNVVYTKNMKTLFYVAAQKKISVFSLPFTVESINSYAMYYCALIEHVILPPLLKSVGNLVYPTGVKSLTFYQYTKHDIIISGIQSNVVVNIQLIPYPFTCLSHFRISFHQMIKFFIITFC